jgi:hypothetical protein
MLLDTLTGESVLVTERSASNSLQVGDYVYTRVVPAGASYQIVGPPIQVPLVHREALLNILGAGGDVYGLAAWVGQMFAPVQLINNEGEDTVFCRAVLRPTKTSWEELSETLNRIFGEPDDNGWTERVEIDSATVIRCFLTRDGDTLVIQTASVERFERVLNLLMDNVVDLETLEETRTDPSLTYDETDETKEISAALAPDETSPELLEALHGLMREKEDAWLDDSIPALGGMTPRQAVTDPTRREDLIALLNEFDRCREGSPPEATFDVSRLRSLLGF